jgi:hypothetical protein
MKSILKKKVDAYPSFISPRDDGNKRKVSFGGVHFRDDSQITYGHTPTKVSHVPHKSRRTSFIGFDQNVGSMTSSQSFRGVSNLFDRKNPIGNIIDN